ncbi:histidine kinase dimerization/phospho-acceptor domain-containing protein [Sphingomonas sp. MMS24-JH45]
MTREQARAASLTDLMHELRSPLGAIALNASILRRSGAMVPGAGAALAIDSGCMTISRLLDDVLSLERLEAGLMPPSVAQHDLAALVREVAAMMAAEAEDYGVALSVRTEPVSARSMPRGSSASSSTSSTTRFASRRVAGRSTWRWRGVRAGRW